MLQLMSSLFHNPYVMVELGSSTRTFANTAIHANCSKNKLLTQGYYCMPRLINVLKSFMAVVTI